ncbi:MAG: indole-3-glycerol-phosphate synthase [Pseudomonadota bacterium]
MSDFLNDMAANSRDRAASAMQQRGEDALWSLVESCSAAPALLLRHPFEVIAEIKGTSPAEGALADHATLDRAGLARQYAAAGACAVSVLTEPSRFDGSLEHLAEVAQVLAPSSVPVMRKDFITSPYQLLEARVAGAGGVLLIIAMLDDMTLMECLQRASALRLFVLLECFDEDDIARSKRLLKLPAAQQLAASRQLLVGVNTRDLRTLAVDATRLERLAPLLPDDIPLVAESGLKTPDDVARAAALGYRVALVGTALMRADDPAGLIARFRSAA